MHEEFDATANLLKLAAPLASNSCCQFSSAMVGGRPNSSLAGSLATAVVALATGFSLLTTTT
jgi:hypothetical protein